MIVAKDVVFYLGFCSGWPYRKQRAIFEAPLDYIALRQIDFANSAISIPLGTSFYISNAYYAKAAKLIRLLFSIVFHDAIHYSHALFTFKIEA